ncbi:MAG TPA: Na+/H+ antiporter [Ktedonobacter sp.]|nr:Na+/H+ antiporter [Ktedonobacter sp.]
MTSTITLVLGLLVVTVVFASIATRLHIPYAILLVVAGALLGLIPGLPAVNLSPDIVLFLFLPPLIYSSAWLTSWREFRANLRPILLLSIGLVLVTMLFVALVVHYLLNLPWAVGFVLGAILGPTDAVAATAIAQRMGLARRVMAILEGESLINDATALVAYTFAVNAVVTGNFQLSMAALQFVLVALGGLLIGLIVAWPISWLHSRLDDAPIEITITLLTPFAAYLLAEVAHVSGVLAALAAGLYLSRRSPRFFSSDTRLQANAVWNVLIFILNGLLFLLIGLQLRQAFNTTGTHSIFVVIADILLVSLAVIIIRLAWVFAETYIPRRLSRRFRTLDPYPDWRNVVILGWTGLRGSVSLASVLALPLLAQNNTPFPERELLISITFGVILVTLVGQGLSLIPLIRILKPGGEESLADEQQHAQQVMLKAALRRLQEVSDRDWVSENQLAHLRSRYEAQLRNLHSQQDETTSEQPANGANHLRLLNEVIRAKRNALIHLRDTGQLDDTIFRGIEHTLDLEEQRFLAEERIL